MWKQLKNQRGFTLIELMVVIAILGVLAAVAVPMITNYLDSAKARSFSAEKERIQNAVDAFSGAPDNARFIGKRQYPLIGRFDDNPCATSAQSCTATTTAGTIIDDGNPFTSTSTELWNPVGGTQGITLSSTSSTWTDSGQVGVRDTSALVDTWARVSVSRGVTTYYTDPRYFFIDFEVLVDDGLLASVPDSASTDNKPKGSTGSYTGSYIWYVDADGKVQALYTHFPLTTTGNTGYRDGVFP